MIVLIERLFFIQPSQTAINFTIISAAIFLEQPWFICRDWTCPLLKSCPHRVSALVGTDLVVTILSNRICTGYARNSSAVWFPGQQSTNDVSFLRICITRQYVQRVRCTGQIHPKAGAKKFVLRLLEILPSLWTFKMTPKMTNISVNSSDSHVKLEILVEN